MVLAISCGSAWAFTEGAGNNFFGTNAGASNQGSGNTFIGGSAGGYSGGPGNTGGYNTFLGYTAGRDNTSGQQNTCIGASAGYVNQAGSGNVFLGFGAGESETGDNKLFIDNCYTEAGCTQPLIYGEFDNRVVKIDGSLTMVTIATPSDVRYKKGIKPLDSSLDKVMHLQGVTYEWDKNKVNGAGYKTGKQIGLIAQEVEQVLPELVQTDSKGYKTLSYDKLTPVIIEAMKEQQKEIREKDARIEKLEKALEIMERRMVALESPSKTIALK
jgi:hypothetical protein